MVPSCIADAQLTAFIATANPDQARRFYEDTLGLRLVDDSRFALVFDANGVVLRVQKVTSVSPPTGTALGWQVGNIRQVITDLSQRGVRFERFPPMEQDDRGIWTSPDGAKVAWFNDPDDNMLSVSEN